MTTRTLAAALLMSLTSCLTSPPALSIAQADGQRGALGSVYMSDGRQHSGELLAFDDSTIVILTGDRVAIGALDHIDRVSFEDFETMYTGLHHNPSSRTLRQGRKVSRFPYGITAEAMTALLTSTKQTSPDRLESMNFIKEARDANRRYESQRQAIDDGFTRVGVEFPAMGEHWVSFARVMEDSLAANRPSVLIYTNVSGEPRLAGVAYTKLLTGNDRPPAFPFAGAWHEHSGAVNEESLPMSHAHVVPTEIQGSASQSPRLFILHAWLYTENPAGIFATDNWALPLTRLGVSTNDAPKDAVRAVALAEDEDEYHRMVVRTKLQLSDDEDSVVARIIDVERRDAESEATTIRASQQFTRETSARLSNTWAEMWLQLERALPTRVAELRHLRAVM